MKLDKNTVSNVFLGPDGRLYARGANNVLNPVGDEMLATLAALPATRLYIISALGASLPEVKELLGVEELPTGEVAIDSAGTTSAVGIYTQAGIVDGKLSYENGPITIYWDADKWLIEGPDGTLYESEDDVATPDLVDIWVEVEGQGELPLPVFSTPTYLPEVAFQVGSEDIEITDTAKGVILSSPDGTRFRLQVANDGDLSAVEVA